MKQMAFVSGIALCFWILSGCQSGAVGGKPEQPPAQASPSPNAGGLIPPGADAQVALVKEDIAKRLGISTDTVQITGVQEVQWGDTALGCPEPGKMYAQVITPGYRISAEAQGQSYEFHTDKGSKVVPCSK